MRIRRLEVLVLCGLTAGSAACGRDDLTFGLGEVPGLDGGPTGGTDAFVPADAGDAGSPDAFMPPDVGFPDAFVPPDAGFPDGMVPPDAGFPDAFVPPDAGFPDAFVPPDGGFPDAFVPPDAGDGGSPDAFVPPDAGFPDSGVPCPGGCGFLDGPCVVGVCSADGVTCVRAPRPDGTRCSDGDPCTLADACQAGRCVAGAPRDCSGLSDDCNVGACDVRTGQCRARPLPDGAPCDDGDQCTVEACAMGQCVAAPAPPPPGDDCARPIRLTLPVGGQSQTGSNVCAADDVQPVCAPAPGGGDIVYELNPTVTRRVRLTTAQPSSGAPFDTVLTLSRFQCPPTGNLACSDDVGASALSEIDEVLRAGRHFVAVDAAGAADRGAYELLVEVDPHDTCAAPSVLPIPAIDQTVFVNGNTTDNGDDFQASCAGRAGSPDQVWSFTLSRPTLLRFETLSVGGQYDTALHVRSSTCAPGSVGVVACDDDGGQGTLSRIEQTFGAGTHYLVVDGFAGRSAGEYRLAVTQIAPLSPPLVFPAAGDARQPLTGPFSISGEFVEGIRSVSVNPARRMEIDVQLANNLSCGIAVFRVRLNNDDVGQFRVRAGDTVARDTFSFSPVSGGPSGRYNIRYELANDIPSRCGSVGLPDGVSTVRIGN